MWRSPLLAALCAAVLPLNWRISRCGLGPCRSGLVAAEGQTDLIDKFKLLKELVDSKADADPELKKQVEAMEQQIEELKAGQAQLDATKADLLTRTQNDPEAAKKAEGAWAASCFAMATETLGGTLSKDEVAALERLAKDELPAPEAAGMSLFRMASVCIAKRTEQGDSAALALDLLTQVARAVKEGEKPPLMPAAWVEQSDRPEAQAEVRELPLETWALMKEQAERATKKPHWTERGPPMIFLLAAIVPTVQLIQYFQKKWDDKKKAKQAAAEAEAADKTAKKEKKKDK